MYIFKRAHSCFLFSISAYKILAMSYTCTHTYILAFKKLRAHPIHLLLKKPKTLCIACIYICTRGGTCTWTNVDFIYCDLQNN